MTCIFFVFCCCCKCQKLLNLWYTQLCRLVALLVYIIIISTLYEYYWYTNVWYKGLSILLLFTEMDNSRYLVYEGHPSAKQYATIGHYSRYVVKNHYKITMKLHILSWCHTQKFISFNSYSVILAVLHIETLLVQLYSSSIRSLWTGRLAGHTAVLQLKL